ncbi:Hsp20/alpha crystallin family protein [bacterium]|nr:Hsp20/alpha crystallin family protein [bacterium]MBU1073225.1 Hsp20/alpha crystallin family protein [bacterium]MBU1675203.1 Hsp20/alpha crystallin family protein [bacterium]
MTTTNLMPLGLSNIMDSFFAPAACRADEGRELRRVPRAEVLEGDKDYIIRMDMPGVNRENLEIEIEDDTLRVRAHREREVPEGYSALRNEWSGGKISFNRAFTLGRGIASDGVKATLEQGTLTLVLPKSEQAMPRRIEVK